MIAIGTNNHYIINDSYCHKQSSHHTWLLLAQPIIISYMIAIGTNNHRIKHNSYWPNQSWFIVSYMIAIGLTNHRIIHDSYWPNQSSYHTWYLLEQPIIVSYMTAIGPTKELHSQSIRDVKISGIQYSSTQNRYSRVLEYSEDISTFWRNLWPETMTIIIPLIICWKKKLIPNLLFNQTFDKYTTK